MKNINWSQNEAVNRSVLWLILLVTIIFTVLKNKFKQPQQDPLILQKGSGNERKSRLSLEELRSCNGFEQISELEGYAAIESLEKYSHLLYELFIEQKKIKK